MEKDIKPNTKQNNASKGQENTLNSPVSPMQVNVPDNLNVVYTDSTFVHKNKFGIVLDFAQTVGPTNRQNVVARVGMSKEHAKALYDALDKNLKD